MRRIIALVQIGHINHGEDDMTQSNLKSALPLVLACGFSPMAATDAKAGSEDYLGEVMLVGANFCPRGSLEADGRELLINEYTALFSLYGAAYGGDGRSTFALPDLRDQGPTPKRNDYVGSFKWCVAVQGIFPSRN